MKWALSLLVASGTLFTCGGPQSPTINEGRGWYCTNVRGVEKCARTIGRCLQLAVHGDEDDATCDYYDTAVCFRYSEAAEDAQAWICGRESEDCRELKQKELGMSRILLRDCELRR